MKTKKPMQPQPDTKPERPRLKLNRDIVTALVREGNPISVIAELSGYSPSTIISMIRVVV